MSPPAPRSSSTRPSSLLLFILILLSSSTTIAAFFSAFIDNSAATTTSSTTAAKMTNYQFYDIPKKETGIYDLYQKYSPSADGTGIKIAIMDTGCDLSATGLSGTTSDGITPKYIDFVDCTGDGDIPMDTNNTVDFTYTDNGNGSNNNNTIKGLSGRSLQLGSWAKNITVLHLGVVRLYELLPRSVMRRVKRERKEAFMIKHMDLLSKTQLELDGLSSSNNSGSGSSGGSGGSAEKEDDKDAIDKKKKELKLMLEQLTSIKESYYDEDSGPLMDILIFQEDNDNDEKVWKAVIDLEANGNLTNSIPMAPFRYNRQVGELGFGSHVSFCIQVYDEGKTLSIVTDAGSHGTHVAGIASSYFGQSSSSGEEKDDEEKTKVDNKKHDLNGVAPGAQILALKIGDGRLGSSETGTGLIRGLITAKKYGCDLVNLSYGEPSWQPDVGRVSEVFAKAFNDWGMTVFTSAGNDGPALSSLGSPGSLTSVITVGAWVSPQMMIEQYSTLPPEDDDAPLEGASYYFSSRGPTPDGFLPDVCGPGGAVAPVPRASLQGKAQYHGTSMSSPNVCGVAACVLSAVRQNGANACGPNELKRALKNTAIASGFIVDPFAQGSGLVSALDCADYIIKNHGKEGQSIAIDVSFPARNNARGLYIRDEVELDGPKSFTVLVKPQFSHANMRTSSEMDELLSLELHLLLKSSEAWVTCPESMTLMSAKERNGQTFSVRLNTQDLKPGVHYASVDALDASDEARGPLFSVPITVIVPHSRFVSTDEPKFQLSDTSENESIALKDNGLDLTSTFQLAQGVPNRRFFTVPMGAEWATIKLKSNDAPRVLLHAIPFVRGDMPNTECQLKRFFQMKEGVEEEYHIRVKGGSSLEVCLQLLWLANPSPGFVTADIEFHSFNIRGPTLVSSQPVTITASSEFARLGASAPLRAEQLNPECKLKSVLRTLRPNNIDITLGSAERDKEPPSDAALASNADEVPSRIYEMRLTYQFKVDGDKPIDVRPSFPSLFNQLYDSPVDSQLWSLSDNNSKIITYGSSMHHASPTSLKKGDYTVTLLLRHPSRSSLDQMKDLPCEIDLKMPTALDCKLYDELDKASTPAVKDDRKAMEKKLLPKGSYQDIYVARPTEDLPSWVAPGDVIQGSLVLDKEKVAVSSMKLLYIAPPKATAKNGDDEKSKEKDKEDSLEDVVFKAKLDHAGSLRAKNVTVYKEIIATLKEERPSSVPLLSEMLTFALEGPLPDDNTDDEDQVRAAEVEQVYNDAMKSNGGPIDVSALAQYFGLNEPDKDELDADDEAKDLNKEMKEQRDVLKKILLARASLYGSLATKDSSKVSRFGQTVKELKQWVKLDSLKDDDEKITFTITLVRHANLCQDRKALAISLLLKAKKDISSGKKLKKLDEELLVLFDSVEMSHVKENLQEGIYYRYPVFKRNV